MTIPAPDLRPEAFLRHAAGEPRGFWARGDRWVAHRGVVAEIGGAPDPGLDRFEAAARAGAAVARNPILASSAVRAPRVRFYGGFSFRTDHHPRGMWSEFPAALFHVPSFELEGDGSGDAWLRARSLVPEDAGDDPEGVLARLRRTAEALRAELATQAERGDDTPGGETLRSPVEGVCRASDRPTWEEAVEDSLAALRAGRVSKVVLARTLDVATTIPVALVEVATRLWTANRGSHVFLFEPRTGSAILGAAPETIATLRDGVFHATAVAGSIRRGDTPREGAELAARLLASEKDRVEQRLVRDDVVARLETVAHQIRTDPQPHVLALPRIQHLETEIRASVPPGTGVLDLLRLLHPTPAVCGLPRDAALSLLAEEEPFERGWYAGPVGWFDGDGNGVFAPALRTAVTHGGRWRLFAGAGIVEGSVPALEWEETGMKFAPVLEALEASGVELDVEGGASGAAAAGVGSHDGGARAAPDGPGERRARGSNGA